MVKQVTVSTESRLDVCDVTDRVRDAIPEDVTGTVTVVSAHTTAGVTVNEAESRLHRDFVTALDNLIADTGWVHDDIDDNADAHIRALLVGASETLPVVDGELQLGTWQAILLVECDGPRTRTIRVAVS